MYKVRYLTIQFDHFLNTSDIRKFRAAVIEKTKRESSLFHNHRPDGSSIYRYPLIQYKVINGKPMILCLAQATEDIHYFLGDRDFKFNIGGKLIEFRIEDVHLQYFPLQTRDEASSYELQHWIGLNQKHHKRFQELKGDRSAQNQLLESILLGNILALAKGINWWVTDTISLTITKIKEVNILPIHKNGKKNLAFTLDFSSNVVLPNYVGLGKRVSIGFGVVKGNHSNNKN